MTKKLITAGIISMLLLASVLIMPIINAKNTEIINKRSNTIEQLDGPEEDQELLQYFNKFMNSINNNDFDEDALTFLYKKASTKDEDMDTDDISAIYGENFKKHLDYFLVDDPANRNPRLDKDHMMGLLSGKNSKEGLFDSDNIQNKVEYAMKLDIDNLDDLDDIPDSMLDRSSINHEETADFTRNWMKEMYNEITTYLETLPADSATVTLISKLANSGGGPDNDEDDEDGDDDDDDDNEEEKTKLKFLLVALFAIAFAGFSALPLSHVVIAFVLAFAAAAGVNYALTPTTTAAGEKLAERFPQLGLSPESWTSIITTVVGVTAFSICFLLFSTNRIGRLGGSATVMVAGIVAINVLIDKYWSKAKSAPTPTRMPLMKILFLNLLQRFAPRLKLFALCNL